MNKKLSVVRLSTQFTLAALAAIATGVLVFFVITSCGGGIVRAHVISSEYIEQSIERKIGEFQKFVDDNGISAEDRDEITDWVNRQKNVILSIHDNGRMIYDSTMLWRGNHSVEETPPPQNYREMYTVKFADRYASVGLFELVEYKFMVVVNYVATFFAIAAFLLLYTGFIRYKVRYITQIEGEVNILEGGDLNYKMTVRGNDELSYLAESIDKMRLSIIERQSEEEQARFANHKLVTAMSHDLRTPLTILIGLLEIADGKKYKTQQELEAYIAKAKNKAYQIKELSDRIFEYFFAFDIKESQLKKEAYGVDVINTMIEDYIFSLGEKGYTFNYKGCEAPCRVMLDTKVFGRVFVNIFSNILKYAHKEKPIEIKSGVINGSLKVSVKNSIIKKSHNEESTNIGLEVCKNIVLQHGGTFEYEENTAENTFTAVISLPVIK